MTLQELRELWQIGGPQERDSVRESWPELGAALDELPEPAIERRFGHMRSSGPEA